MDASNSNSYRPKKNKTKKRNKEKKKRKEKPSLKIRAILIPDPNTAEKIATQRNYPRTLPARARETNEAPGTGKGIEI
jgi:hypothetical protein